MIKKQFKSLGLAIVLTIVSTGYISAQETSQEKPAIKKKAKEINSGTVSALKLRNIGPALTSGRIGDVAIDQENPNTWYIAAASGNVWKTTNAGITFTPIFENYGSYSIGCISIDPSNSNTIWVGTGENNGGRHIGFGDGVYVSYNAGKSFKNMGLKKSEHISKVLIDPRNSNTIFVASQGPLWSPGGERGLYKSTDGGKNWKNVLSAGEYTGVTDVVFDPKNPRTLYAATHQRHRNVWALLNCGPESRIHKSTDGGETWTQLGGGLPGGDVGKMSLQVSPFNSNTVYATIELPGKVGGFYRTDDAGVTWRKMSDYLGGGTGPHYYQEIFCDPHRKDVIYQVNVQLARSEDGGATWDNIEGRNKHVDNHAIAFHPTDKDFILVGCDGGVYKSYDYGKNYQYCANLPLTQFYKIDVDYDYPFYHVVGGTQDNFSQYGPTRTGKVQGITNADWRITIGGDGHDNAIDPEDPNTIYCESQQGNIRRYDRKTGESVGIQPQPGKGEEGLRFNWDSPILISPHSHTRIYFGSKKLHRSDDRGDSWTSISPDLSKNQNRYELPTMGKVPSVDDGYDLRAMSRFGNITSISESPLVEGLIYVGTDDGLIQVTEDGGENWRKIDKIFGVPENFFVNDIKADLHDENTVYAVMDDHKRGDYKPYLAKSSDRGATWELMNGNLPENHILWRIVQDHEQKNLFFLATEFGIFFTVDAGEQWIKLKAGAPTISFRDLAIQKRENDLVAASFGRGRYVLDDYSPLRELSGEMLANTEHYIFPIRKALWYSPSDRLGGRKGFQGDSLFNADNPEFGATFTYYVRDSAEKTMRQKRKANESKIKAAGGDVPFPGWDALRQEVLEQPVKMYLQVKDADGNLVARVNASTSAGLHRATWNLNYSSLTGGRFAPIAPPGTYNVTLMKSDDGELTELSEPVEFEVESIVDPTLPPQDRAEIMNFVKQTIELSNAIGATQATLDARLEQMPAIKTAIEGSFASTTELLADAAAMELKLKAAQTKLGGDAVKAGYYEQTVPSVSGRVRGAMFGSMRGTYGPTQTHREQVAIAAEEFAEMADELKALVTDEFEAFEAKLDDAGIPWTPGRKIPNINE